MDLQHLRYFQAVARDGGFSSAARTLGVSQSTLSEAVRKLEDGLGTTLFQRTRTGVVPTEAGALLLERASAVFGLVTSVTDELRDLGRGEQGRFVLGCHDRLGGYFLPSFLREFLPEHPGIELEVVAASSGEVRRAVLDRDLHFGLVVNTEPHPDLVIREAFRDLVQVFGPAPARDEREAIALLSSSVLAVPSRSPFDAVLAQLAARGVAPKRVLHCGDLGVTRSIAVAGVALALLPWRVATDGPGLAPLHPALPFVEDRIHLVWRADLHRTQAGRRVREALLAAGRNLPEPPTTGG